jgi:hypothetical protein
MFITTSLISTVLKGKYHKIFEGELRGPLYCEYSKE